MRRASSRRDLAQVRQVRCCGRITRVDAGAQRRERLLAHAADRQHAAAQRDLAGHRDVVRAPGCAVASETSAVAIVTPADGPSFGIAPAGTCTWISRRTSAPSSSPRSREAPARAGERRLARLLHHVAELAGEHEPAARASSATSTRSTSPPASVQARPFATPDLAAARGRRLGRVARRAEQLVEAARASRARARVVALGGAARDLAADRRDLALEVAHAGLARVLGHDVAHRGRATSGCGRRGSPCCLDAGAGSGTSARSRASPRACSPASADHLHAVAQRPRDRVEQVRGGDEADAARGRRARSGSGR